MINDWCITFGIKMIGNKLGKVNIAPILFMQREWSKGVGSVHPPLLLP
jgi:hypothetical protein